MTKKTQPREIRQVVWTDSLGGSGWRSLSDVEKNKDIPAPIIHSVGFVVSENEEHVTLLQSFDDQPGDAKADNWIQIPKVAIKSQKVIR